MLQQVSDEWQIRWEVRMSRGVNKEGCLTLAERALRVEGVELFQESRIAQREVYISTNERI